MLIEGSKVTLLIINSIAPTWAACLRWGVVSSTLGIKTAEVKDISYAKAATLAII